MDRLGALELAALTGESKQLYEDIKNYFEGNVNYTYRLCNGQMVGPFGIELHTPGAGYAWLKMTKSLAEITELPPLAREVAILRNWEPRSGCLRNLCPFGGVQA
ncbi:hypothetical protein INS49_000493 [Diaporthe citri]|uniref:uncharacterized protein n=1 Tax=Diaporthe citri TaxID=83186 RepID=UPI001C7FA192|nr:uncharacterized protein INS49_000493 [Diaporthe citri]KAG6366316.1 hypothetical protein INS49_000493 [Diaporthe citri]